ncbi:related to 3-ketodihydrosphingosine reductase TSC10 [Saccharomycodes ludwigii]|uniref:3-ketodihydrosphingosine reductase TSC10 n=1 Tax=Saccharomycodes ludwigii TaxID=36035 RepID=A0A376B3B4_9ASCO|nr:hypothetical protein SCDLUD_003554 [Saccharomycodes ludwigii]KAH3900563.1 hypothetical protein SCDLUD_003554 [Saccharomycodes ludwigii]SSD58620.1 related to 3-ketodihydrosphingosine reductase TSC10 [Saccharomycodes ludwigii]
MFGRTRSRSTGSNTSNTSFDRNMYQYYYNHYTKTNGDEYRIQDMNDNPKNFSMENQTVLISGGSQGLGFQFARKYYKETCNTRIILVSRSSDKLINACEKITGDEHQSPSFLNIQDYDEKLHTHIPGVSNVDQNSYRKNKKHDSSFTITNNKNNSISDRNIRLFYYPCDLSKAEDVQGNLISLLVSKRLLPTQVFFCAGGAHPALFKDMELQQLENGVTMNYLSALYLSHSILKLINTYDNYNPHLIFFNSEAIFFPFIGYSQYAPLKQALKCLVSILRHEYPNQRISNVYPGNFDSEGFKVENETKPEITVELEGKSTTISCEACCDKIIWWLGKGYDDITTELLGWFLMSLDLGLNKNWNYSIFWFLQLLIGCIFNLLVAPFYMFFTDRLIKNWSRKQSGYNSSSSASIIGPDNSLYELRTSEGGVSSSSSSTYPLLQKTSSLTIADDNDETSSITSSRYGGRRLKTTSNGVTAATTTTLNPAIINSNEDRFLGFTKGSNGSRQRLL